MSILTYKFRILPTKAQTAILEDTLELCRWTYNQTLAYRKDAWEGLAADGQPKHKSVSRFDTQKLLPVWKQEAKPDLKNVFSQVLQDVQRRVDLAFQNFFRRVKNHEDPGYPRFKGRGWYDSFTYPQKGFKILDAETVYLSKIGEVKMKVNRKIEGVIKTLTVSKSTRDKWYCCLTLEQEDQILITSANLPSIGIDLGLENYLTLSDGTKVDNPRFFRAEETNLARYQSKRDKLPKGSKERFKVTKVVQRIHERITNKRLNFAHQLSHDLVNQYGLICFEDLDEKSMLEQAASKCGLAKSIMDASWNMLVRFTQYKAARAGSEVVLVDPRNTSKECSSCGEIVEKDLKTRVHKCPRCGLEMDRDHNAAINILNRGTACLKPNKPADRARPDDAGGSLLDYNQTGATVCSTIC